MGPEAASFEPIRFLNSGLTLVDLGHYLNIDAPVAQLDRAPPSEGGGHTFESCRARHSLMRLTLLTELQRDFQRPTYGVDRVRRITRKHPGGVQLRAAPLSSAAFCEGAPRDALIGAACVFGHSAMCGLAAMSAADDFRIRPGRIRSMSSARSPSSRRRWLRPSASADRSPARV